MNVLVDKQKIDILANAISDKSGEPVTMTLDEMVEAVDGIETNPAPTLQAKTYTVDSAGTETITADSGYDGLSGVEVSVPEAVVDMFLPSYTYATENGVRKFKIRSYIGVDAEGFIEDGDRYSEYRTFNAIATNTSITPTESSQTIGGSNYMMEGAVTVNAISSSYVGSGITRRSSSDLTASGATVTVPSGYYSAQASKSISTGTEGTPTATKGTVSNHAVSVTPSVTNTAGYISGGTKTGTAVSVSASELVSGTYTVDSSGTKDVTNYASASVPSGTAGTPSASKGTVSNHSVTVTPSVTNTTGWITGSTKTGTAVTVSASELVSGSQTISQNGTVDVTNLASIVVDVQGGGGGGGMQIETATTTPSSASTSITFTGLRGEPTSFVVTSAADLATGTPAKTAAVVFDGTSLHGQTVTNTSDAQASYDGTNFSKTYSNGTLTITGTSYWQANQYKLVYTYGGNASNIGTDDVQVGSGATSITFTGLEDEPDYFSVIFKSNFSTSSGYQRVMAVAYDGTSTYGLAMDSGEKAMTSWSYTYNNGSLTVSSVGTNNGGYFHQPGYYQLTYGVGGEASPYQKINKTYTPTTSTQTEKIEPSTGYDAISEVNVTVNPIPSQYIIPTGNYAITANGNNINIAQYATVSVNVPSSGGANIATETTTNSSNQNTSISFTLPSGRTPKAFFARLTSQIARSSNSRYYYVFDMRWDGSSTGGVAGNTFYMYSGTLTNVTSGYSKSQSGTTFTLSSTGSRSTSPGSFYNGTYELIYVY